MEPPADHMPQAADRSRRWRLAVRGCAAALLALPLAAMQVTPEVNWGPADFGLAAALLLAAVAAFEIATRAPRGGAYRAGVALAVAGAVLLVWANLAVGLIGTEGDPANLAFLGVLAVAGLGAAAARLRPRGMARAFGATALAQALVAAAALVAGLGTAAAAILVLAVPWLASAWLFRAAARAPAPPPA